MIRVQAGSFAPFSVASNDALAWRAPSSAEMAALDRRTIDAGTPALELMERAGAAVATSVQPLLGGSLGRVLVLCGPGNNGGDGLVVARLLASRGVAVTAVLASATKHSPECLEQLGRLGTALCMAPVPAELLSKRLVEAVSGAEVKALLASATVVVDALLGTGQRAELKDGIAELVKAVVAEKLSRPSLRVLAVDIPTGVLADTGAVTIPHITADVTVAIELIKRGCLQFPGRAASGEIVTAPIGISAAGQVEFSLVEGAARPVLARRLIHGHKGDSGRVLVVGGSAAMPGAPLLSALGALYAGAGLVSRVWRRSWGSLCSLPECMNEILAGDSDFLTPEDIGALRGALLRADAVVLGPGLGLRPETQEFVRAALELLKSERKRVIIDADALTHLSMLNERLSDHAAVITPHPGEAATLLGKSVQAVQGDRFSAVRELSERFGCTVVLKGAGTMVAGEGRAGIVARGSQYMATAGSGDVLAGVVSACAVRSASLFDAAAVAAYVHACAGERASAENGGPVLASEIARSVASVMGALDQ